MKCSICMATFNHVPLLRKTLRSIFAQRVPFAFEVIVANDGSTDETAEVLDDFPKVRAIHLPAKSTTSTRPGPATRPTGRPGARS